MPFSYYRRLSRRNQAIYQKSDAIHAVRLPEPARLRPHVEALRRALEADEATVGKNEQRAAVSAIAERLCRGITDGLAIPPVKLSVLATRPHDAGGELHGLYTWDDEQPPEIKVWMRTAKQKRVVAFKTFLRTLLHEICHHLDVRYYKLTESFHTEGFYKRESSLFHQLAGPLGEDPAAPPAPRVVRQERDMRPVRAEPAQQSLPGLDLPRDDERG